MNTPARQPEPLAFELPPVAQAERLEIFAALERYLCLLTSDTTPIVQHVAAVLSNHALNQLHQLETEGDLDRWK
ncbi:MAG: hypothetical protein A3H96_21790 [Acidobacteria bacterium RIFCSPLOWO2_02_FULL_67_36]|nr:MAG: hypothetical protein A3H96_21790 [Acidobacteria bacterium RIFCSPLOWO2_02_FULL_67_36]OFW19829.1 MAG: hypothetical protein A3G21_09385 [Acidobacteria bacterium RIFCSPLOWO2_12_FULL_66_21]